MPRPAKGARLHKFKHRPYWYIRDTGQADRSTGCERRAEAEKTLAAYIATKGREGAANEPQNITCGEVLTIYAEEHAPTVADPARIGYSIDALLPFWCDLKLSHIKGETCRRYTKVRNRADGTVRRELGTLQAAINYAHREGFITSAPIVTLPEKPASKDRWLTRDEAARLLWAAYRGHKSKHIARFILIALYTGTRKEAILEMSLSKDTVALDSEGKKVGGWFDLENRLMYRIGSDARKTKKRRSPAPIPRQLLAHLNRWSKSGDVWAVQYNGARVGDIKRGFITAVETAGLLDVTPHTLKHTAITWLLQNGVSPWECAGFFSTSAETIQKTYGHHSPEYQKAALDSIERRRS